MLSGLDGSSADFSKSGDGSEASGSEVESSFSGTGETSIDGSTREAESAAGFDASPRLSRGRSSVSSPKRLSNELSTDFSRVLSGLDGSSADFSKSGDGSKASGSEGVDASDSCDGETSIDGSTRDAESAAGFDVSPRLSRGRSSVSSSKRLSNELSTDFSRPTADGDVSMDLVKRDDDSEGDASDGAESSDVFEDWVESDAGTWFDGVERTNSSGNSSSPKRLSNASERLCGLSSIFSSEEDSSAFSPCSGRGPSVSAEPKIPERAAEISFPSISSVGNSSFSPLAGEKSAIALSRLFSKSRKETSLSPSSSAGSRVASDEKGSSSFSSLFSSSVCSSTLATGASCSSASA